MWICNKNNQLINVEKIQYLTIKKGKDYYDDNAVMQTYYYICADDNKIIKTSNKEDAFGELENIKAFLKTDNPIYQAGGVIISEDEQGNLID